MKTDSVKERKMAKKYKKHYMSKYEYPTRIITKSLIIGSKSAKNELVKKLGRDLAPGTKIVTRGGNWCFMEPVGLKANENV